MRVILHVRSCLEYHDCSDGVNDSGKGGDCLGFLQGKVVPEFLGVRMGYGVRLALHPGSARGIYILLPVTLETRTKKRRSETIETKICISRFFQLRDIYLPLIVEYYSSRSVSRAGFNSQKGSK